MSQRLSKRTLVSLALLGIILLFSGLLLYGQPDSRSISVSYWLWAGLTAHDAPANSELYVFQGRIYTTADKTSYERLGLYPHPLKCKKLLLVYRLEGELPDVKAVIEVFQRSVTQWQRHPVIVSGIQLDFDSPTSKLLAYSRFVENVRRELPQEYALSITGLGDWAISGNQEAMQSLSSSADEIVFQLYQGRQPLGDIETYIQELATYPLPFRVGLITGSAAPPSVNSLKANPNYRGIIYFIQKAL